MRGRQLAGVADRKLRHLVVPRLPVDFDARYARSLQSSLLTTPGPLAADTTAFRSALSPDRRAVFRDRYAAFSAGRLRFLGQSRTFEDPGAPNWNRSDLDALPGLWRLKFHGFQFLRWLVLGTEPAAASEADVILARRAIEHWSETVSIGEPQYLRRTWTPHAVTFRILNWSRFYCWGRPFDEGFAAALRRAIYTNARFLANHVEHEVGGNHLIENAAALVAAGTLFDGPEADGWKDTAVAVRRTATDQFLADGGHFERSPMYHSFCLWRYLTAIHLLAQSGEPVPPALCRTAADAVRFLHTVRGPDGRLPLLNDAVYGQAPAPDTLLAYAERVGITTMPDDQYASMPETGYYWAGDDSLCLLFDCGPVGPPHLPAHSHNDQLAVLLWIDGNPVFTDTGTYEYAPGDRRQHARSVAAHNTVQVGELEPIDIAGRYLMGRRTAPSVRVDVVDGHERLTGRYEKRTLGSSLYTHRRTTVTGSAWAAVVDDVNVAGDRPAISRFHLHPSVTVQQRPNADRPRFDIGVDGEQLASLYPFGMAVDVETTPYYPRFGVERSRSALVGRFCDPGTQTGLLVTTAAASPAGAGARSPTAG